MAPNLLATTAHPLLGCGLLQGEIIIINHDFNSGCVHGQRLAEGAGLAHEHAAALAQGAINGLDDAGLARALGAGSVLPAGQDLGVGFPLVGEEPAVAAVMCRQGLPQLAQRRFGPAAQRLAHNTPPGPFDHEPQPDLALATAHKTPQFIEFQHFPPLAPGIGRAPRRQGRRGERRFFYPFGNRHARHPPEPNNAALRVALA